MKKLYSTLLIIGCFLSLSFAQNYDFGVTAIVDPANGVNVDQNFNDTISVTVKNFGPTLPTTDSVMLRMLVDGMLTNVLYYITPAIPFPSGLSVTVGWLVNLGSLGLSINSHSICWTIYMGSLDTNSANDTTCVSYNIIMTGIESALAQESKIFLSNGQLNVDVTNKQIKGSTALSVYNLAGSLIYSEEIDGDGHVASTVDLSNQSTGMYIVRLLSDGKLIESRKFMK